MSPEVRVSLIRAVVEDITLRCYVEGYYPVNSVSVFWYTDRKMNTQIYNCTRGPFSDGTYRQICDYTCHRDKMYDAVCHVIHQSSNVSVVVSLHRDISAESKLGTAGALISVMLLGVLCAIVAVLYWICGDSILRFLDIRCRCPIDYEMTSQ